MWIAIIDIVLDFDTNFKIKILFQKHINILRNLKNQKIMIENKK